MADIMVHVMLHGLIALVPIKGGDGQVNHMTALLADARQERQEQCMNIKHIPSITFRADNQQCRNFGCKTSSDDCTCTLNFNEIKLTPDVQPLSETKIEAHIPPSLPFDVTKATDFNYVANLASAPLGQTLDRAFLGPTPPSGLVARMSFPFEVVKACALAFRRDEGSELVQPMGFRLLGDLEQEGDTTQAVAQMLMARYMLSQDGAEIPKLSLSLSDFNGGSPRSIDILPSVSTDGHLLYLIQLENSRSDLPLDDACDDGIARDFAHLYTFASNPPPWEKRKIPHIKHTLWKSGLELLDPECRGPKTPLSRPVCPLGSFSE